MKFLTNWVSVLFLYGFSPAWAQLLPSMRLWWLMTGIIYVYRLTIYPVLMWISGTARHAKWIELGAKEHANSELQPYRADALAVTDPANTDAADPDLSRLIAALRARKVQLCPHSAFLILNLGPKGFEANFFNHLIGVWKALAAWGQPRHICRGGLFHSVYGTQDFRKGFFSLKERDQLQQLIGTAAEELVFLTCTADRVMMFRDLQKAMKQQDTISEGFWVRNGITRQRYFVPAPLFAAWCMVVLADFMEQGVNHPGEATFNYSSWKFVRFSFFVDVARFVRPYLAVVPTPIAKYFLDAHPQPVRTVKGVTTWAEPTVPEMKFIERVWPLPASSLTDSDQAQLFGICKSYPYLAEPRILLGSTLKPGMFFRETSREQLAEEAIGLLNEWGMTWYKRAGHMHNVLDRAQSLLGTKKEN